MQPSSLSDQTMHDTEHAAPNITALLLLSLLAHIYHNRI